MPAAYRHLLPRVLELYRDEPRWTRTKIRGRLRSIDYTRVLDELPEQGTLWDFGCGHGFFAVLAHLYRPGLAVEGCDYSEDKMAVAKRCVPESLPIELSLGSEMPGPDSVAAVTMIDVLHYVPFERWDNLLAGAWSALRPGGVFLLKDHDPGLRAKFLWNTVFESLTTRWNKIDKASDMTFKPRAWFESELGALGFDVGYERLDRWSAFSHVLYVARKPAVAQPAGPA